MHPIVDSAGRGNWLGLSNTLGCLNEENGQNSGVHSPVMISKELTESELLNKFEVYTSQCI